MAIIFPAFGGIVIAFAAASLQISGSLYYVWSSLVSFGIPFKSIVLINIGLTSVLWFRTLFLMPIGWLKENTNVYQASPVYNKFKISQITRLESAKNRQLEKDQVGDSFCDNALSVQFILCNIFISFTNLNNLFCAFTWGQYTRFVDHENYKEGYHTSIERVKLH